MLRKIGSVLKEEIKRMCAHKTRSKFRAGSFNTIQNFKWIELLDDLKMHTPILFNILHACTDTKFNSGATICVCAGILFKFHFSHVNLIQKMISVILHAGHCGKKVYQRFL